LILEAAKPPIPACEARAAARPNITTFKQTTPKNIF
jgi:hypothetical protein